MTKFPKKEPINFRYFYDSAGVTQTLLWSNQFINPTVWYIFVQPSIKDNMHIFIFIWSLHKNFQLIGKQLSGKFNLHALLCMQSKTFLNNAGRVRELA